jgi:hypothetical protein
MGWRQTCSHVSSVEGAVVVLHNKDVVDDVTVFVWKIHRVCLNLLPLGVRFVVHNQL